jgi:hypothetical protein
MTIFGLALLILAAPPPSPQPPGNSNGTYLYRAALIQAAPGKLLELIDLYKAGWPGLKGSGDEPPLGMRHSQGDRWDLLLLFPMGSLETYFAPDRLRARQKGADAAGADRARLASDVAWQEDVFVLGPPLEEVRRRLDGAGFFHVEMFDALPGRRADLQRQREMENAYSRAIGAPENLIFTREAGAHWDLFTIGGFRDLKHYASSADVPPEKQEEAARAAGFDGAKAIGPYLRTLIASHHDTLAVAIK